MTALKAVHNRLDEVDIYANTRIPFALLVGFIVTQGYQIPLFSLPVNWAIWPSPTDLFAYLLVAFFILAPKSTRLTKPNRIILTALLIMLYMMVINFLGVTIPLSQTNDGIRFAAFSIILMTKYIITFWVICHIPLNERRKHILHIASLIALCWLALTTIGDQFKIIEINDFANHLPSGISGKWDAFNINSTVSATHGSTTVTLLALGALTLASSGQRHRVLIYFLVVVLTISTSFIVGSRQGLIRSIVFALVYFASFRMLTMLGVGYVSLLSVAIISSYLLFSSPTAIEFENPSLERAIDRQSVLLSSPFTNSGLSGRPELWQSAIETLNENPIYWLVGYGMGNYVEHENSAHNMILQYLQDGGLTMLFILTFAWIVILRQFWIARHHAWALFSLTLAYLTSYFTSGIFYPNLATGWYLGLYFILLHLTLGKVEIIGRSKTH